MLREPSRFSAAVGGPVSVAAGEFMIRPERLGVCWSIAGLYFCGAAPAIIRTAGRHSSQMGGVMFLLMPYAFTA